MTEINVRNTAAWEPWECWCSGELSFLVKGKSYTVPEVLDYLKAQYLEFKHANEEINAQVAAGIHDDILQRHVPCSQLGVNHD